MVYSREYYLKNKEKFLQWQRQYRLKNKDKVKTHRKEYESKPEVRKKRIENKKRLRLVNREKYLEERKKDDKRYYEKTREKQLIYKREHHKIYSIKPEVKERRKETYAIWSQKPEVKARRTELARIWRRNNPRSNGIKDLDLRWAMNRVRLRDNNTCQWQGCGLSHKMGMPIHVHHIFPRSEYPELELIEQYMICYCANHHCMFHRYRGDSYSEMISWKEENDDYALENYH